MLFSSRLGRVVLCLGCAVPAAAQLDSPALRARFGVPLNRETFRIPDGFDLVVDYGASQQVCKLQVPALMPATGNPANLSVMNARMYAFLAELVPDSIRGKETGRFVTNSGTISFKAIEYEHVTIGELYTNNRNTDTITLTFKSEGCPRQTGQ